MSAVSLMDNRDMQNTLIFEVSLLNDNATIAYDNCKLIQNVKYTHVLVHTTLVVLVVAHDTCVMQHLFDDNTFCNYLPLCAVVTHVMLVQHDT